MTTLIKRKHYAKRETDSSDSIDSLYDNARIGARIAYTALPAAAYAASSEKLDEVEGLNWFAKILAKIFYNGDIQRLNELNDHAAKASGVGAGLAVGYVIDKVTEKMLPKNRRIRQILQPAAYFSTANLANLAAHGADSLESLVSDTLVRTGDVIHNIASTGNTSDGEYFMNAGITSLIGLAAVKGVNNLLVRSGIANGAYNFGKEVLNGVVLTPLKLAYNLTLGNANEEYESRRIKNSLKRKAKGRYSREVNEIDQIDY